MIVTLTPDPSLERTLEVRKLVAGTRRMVSSSRVEAGGKGLNVSRALARNGVPTTAVLPAGGPEGAQLTALLASCGVPAGVVPTRRSTRTETTVREADGTETTLCEPGPTLGFADVHALVSEVSRALRDAPGEPGGDWVAVCGELPKDVPADVYGIIADAAHARGARFAVDVAGQGLRDALAAEPDLLKTDLVELEVYTRHPMEGLADVIIAAGRLREAGAGAVLTGLGARGALLVDESGAHFGSARVPRPLSTVGASDAMLAGFLAGSGAGANPDDALATALAWGAAATRLSGSVMPGPNDIDLSSVVAPSGADLGVRWEATG